MNGRLPHTARKVFDTVLDTFEKLELASQLVRLGRPVSLSEVAARTQLGSDATAEVIAALAAARVIEADRAPDPLLRLGPRATHADFAEAMRLYETDRVAVLSELCTLSIERIRGMAARTFAEAFVLTRKKPRR